MLPLFKDLMHIDYKHPALTLGADFWEGDATKHFSVQKGFSVKRGGDSVNQGFGKDFSRKGNSVKRSGPFNI